LLTHIGAPSRSTQASGANKPRRRDADPHKRGGRRRHAPHQAPKGRAKVANMFGKKAVIGLDIGSSIVKAVQLRRSGKAIEIEKCGVAEIYPNGDKGNVAIDAAQATVEAVKRALADGKISAKQAISSVGGEPVIVRYIQMQRLPDEELRNALQWEAEGYIPYDIDEVHIDFHKLGDSADSADKVDVLLVAAKKDLIERHLNVIKKADLVPALVDVDSFAFLNQFEFNYSPDASQVIALIDIGAETTSISIYRDGVSRFSREISIAGDSITGAIQNKLSTTFAQAEKYKIDLGAPAPTESASSSLGSLTSTSGFGGTGTGAGGTGGSDLLDRIRGTVERITGEDLGDDSPEAMARKAIKNTLNNLVNEIKRSIQFYENQASGPAVARVMVGGGSSRMKNIDAYLKGELKLDVGLVDPLNRVRPRGKDVNMAQLNANKPSLSVAVGLALRDIMD
jgi:type IV pilus assembly protein PilM